MKQMNLTEVLHIPHGFSFFIKRCVCVQCLYLRRLEDQINVEGDVDDENDGGTFGKTGNV